MKGKETMHYKAMVVLLIVFCIVTSEGKVTFVVH